MARVGERRLDHGVVLCEEVIRDGVASCRGERLGVELELAALSDCHIPVRRVCDTRKPTAGFCRQVACEPRSFLGEFFRNGMRQDR